MPTNKNLIKSINDIFKKILLEIQVNFEHKSRLDSDSISAPGVDSGLDLAIKQKKLNIAEWLNILNKYNNVFKIEIYKDFINLLEQENLYIMNINRNSNLLDFIKDASIKISTFKQIMIQHLSNYYDIDLKYNKEILNQPIIFRDLKLEKSKSYKYDKLFFIQILDNLILTLEKINKELSQRLYIDNPDIADGHNSYLPKKPS